MLSAALDCGTAVATLLVFFCLDYPRHGTIGEGTIKSWWGNTVYMNTADYNYRPLRHVEPGHHFGQVLSVETEEHFADDSARPETW